MLPNQDQPINIVILILTRLHSSRMRTARALTVSPSLLCAGGVYLVLGGGMSAPGLGRCLLQEGVYLVTGGVPGPGGCTWSGTPPCGQTHACKHITLPQTSFAGGKN